MHENGQRSQYPRPRASGPSPFAKRILVMLAAFVLLLPLANLLKGSNGHIVQTTGLPGGAVSGSPLTAAAPTTTVAAAGAAADASASAGGSAAAPDTTAAAPAITQAAPKPAKTTPPATAAKKAPAATAAPKVTSPPATAKAKAAPPTTAKRKAPPTTAPAPKPAPPPAPAPITAPPNSYTPAQIESIIRQVWPDDLENQALAIAQRESHLIPTSHNYCCYGLFAIYYEAGKKLLNSIGVTSPAQLFDPWVNTRAALAIYQVAGWDPWKL